MIDWRQIDTLLLDMDGTVLDLAFDNFFWLELLPRHVAQARGITVADATAQMRAQTARVYGSLQWYCLDHWSEWLALDVAAIKHANRHRIGYLPGALGFLRLARALGLRLVIVTNAHCRTLAIKSGQTHLERYVDAVYSSHDFGHPKESAAFWRQFETASGVDGRRSVLVDDSAPVIAAARRHGLCGTVTIARPDSGLPARDVAEGPGVDALADLGAALRASRTFPRTGGVVDAVGGVSKPAQRPN